MASQRSRKKENVSTLMDGTFDMDPVDPGTETVTTEEAVEMPESQHTLTEEAAEAEETTPAAEEAPAEKAEDASVIVVPSVQGVEGTADTAEAPEEEGPTLYEELVEILSPQKGKRGVPTLVGFESTYARAKRFAIIDVNEYILADAYARWTEREGGDDEAFLDMVLKITHNEVPRMFRTVAFFDLESARGRTK